ncbi:MAG: TetR/AcrR family transcriptional regulator [Lachnospiraceae bacterium]|nr:TetR/AcrR family transcriptional regulator [Lachnospiraceae bacterium]
MGKAFTENEKIEVQEKLRRTGLRLLAEEGIRRVSIRELTKEAGIAQGGFYTFYKDKDDFIMDLMCLRVREKTDIMYQEREKTLENPKDFIVQIFYKEGMHLKKNMAFKNSESDTISFWQNASRNGNNMIGETYLAFLKNMISYWEENGYRIECDAEGLLNAGAAAGLLFSNADMLDEKYFSEIYKVFCEAEVNRFFKAFKLVS